MSKLYEQVAAEIAAQIDRGVYRPGERIPGVRRLGHQFGVSISTVIQAHQLLEDWGRVEVRARSGYYVRKQFWSPPETPEMTRPAGRPAPVTGQALSLELVQATQDPDLIPLGAAVPDVSFLPTRSINRALMTAARLYGDRDARYEFSPGHLGLRRQIARRMADAGCRVGAEDLVVTGGCQEALTLCLRAVAEPGDIIAIESPTFYGLLQAIDSLGMKALEIPTDARDGVGLEALTAALDAWPVKACALVTNYSNPLGCCMPESHKRRLVALLAQRGIALIEDDIYGDLGFGESRPHAAKAYDQQGQVLYCASFSKTISPGLRVGWIAPGRYRERVEYLKYALNLAAPTLPQLAIADFLERGGYDRYLRNVRREYELQVARMIHAVSEHFPPGTRITQPAGGFVIWIEMPEGVNALELYQYALLQHISIAPGTLFSASQKYINCLRLNCAHRWNERLEQAVATLGRLAGELYARRG